MSKPHVLLAVCVSLLAASPAFAQTRAPHDPQPAAASSYPQKTQRIDIEDGSDVDGVRVNPNLELVDARGRMRQSSLISIRANFQAEILKSAESL